jgi:hypothetical protein
MRVSRKWGEHIEEVIFYELGLLLNLADPALYTGIFRHPLILGRASDDFLCECDHAAYDMSVAPLKLHEEHDAIKFVLPYATAKARYTVPVIHGNTFGDSAICGAQHFHAFFLRQQRYFFIQCRAPIS